MTQYAKQTQLLLGASPYDIPLGKVLKSVVVSIANNLITGSGTGISVTILPNGATPGYTLQYGAADHYTLTNVSWIRIQGNGANVTFDVDDQAVPITPTIVGSSGQHTFYEGESNAQTVAATTQVTAVSGTTVLPRGTLVTYTISGTGALAGAGAVVYVELIGNPSGFGYALLAAPNAVSSQFYMTRAEKLDIVFNNGDSASHYFAATWQGTAA